jgi:hypothetical protein
MDFPTKEDPKDNTGALLKVAPCQATHKNLQGCGKDCLGYQGMVSQEER